MNRPSDKSSKKSGGKLSDKIARRRSPAPAPEARPLGRLAAQAFLERALAEIEPALAGRGFEIIAAQCPFEDGRQVLRLFIDRAESGAETTARSEPENPKSPAASHISLDDCAAASRLADEILEAADWAEEAPAYVLEVSSPGLDRPLRGPADYRRFAGRRVKIKVRRDGRNTMLKGRLFAGEGEAWLVETASGPEPFTPDQALSARLDPDLKELLAEAAGRPTVILDDE